MIKRPLTDGEIKLARSVFGDAIDYAAVTISDGKYMPFQPKGTAMAPNGHLYMYGCYSPDYSAEKSLSRSHFIHEMTHVWQYQIKILNPIVEAAALSLKHKFNYFTAAYAYHLDENMDLMDYGMEQQASIVQEYFMTRREGHTSHTRHCKNTCHDDEKCRLYEKVLEKFLKDPSYTRRSQFPKVFKGKGPKP